MRDSRALGSRAGSRAGSPCSLTEKLILDYAGHEAYGIEEIKLSRMGITTIEPGAFENFPKLHTIDLSRNRISHLPDDLEFPRDQWWRIDLSYNKIENFDSISVLRKCEVLEEILVEFNEGFPVVDEHKLQFYIPSLRRIDDKPADPSKVGPNLTFEIEQQVYEIWKDKRKELFKKFKHSSEQLFQQFGAECLIKVKTKNHSLKDFVKVRLEEGIIPEFCEQYYDDMDKIEAEIEENDNFEREQASEKAKKKADKVGKVKKENLEVESEFERAHRVSQRKQQFIKKHYNFEDRDEFRKSRWKQAFEIKQAIRHGEQKEDSIPVWQVGFEPTRGKYLASVGGNSVILTSTSDLSRPLMKFTPPENTFDKNFRNEEENEICVMNWFEIDGNPHLAVGSNIGNIYILNPEDSKCVKILDDLHSGYLQKLLSCGNVLFSAGLRPKAGSHWIVMNRFEYDAFGKCQVNQLGMFSVVTDPLSMLIVENTLWVGCKDSNSGISVFDAKYQNALIGRNKAKHGLKCDYNLKLDDSAPEICTYDTLCNIDKQGRLVAIRTAASEKMTHVMGREYSFPGFIFLAKFKAVDQSLTVLRRLDFSDSYEIYLPMFYMSKMAVLVAGDERGDLWVYDISDLQNGKVVDGKDCARNFCYVADAIVPFPSVSVGKCFKAFTSQICTSISASVDNSVLVTGHQCNVVCVMEAHQDLFENFEI